MKSVELNKINAYGAADVLYMSYNGIPIVKTDYKSKFAYPFAIGDGEIIIDGAGETHKRLNDELSSADGFIAGRIWANIVPDESFDEIFNGYSILTFWNSFSDVNVVDGKLMNELFTRLGVDKSRIILVKFKGWLDNSATLEMYRGGNIILNNMSNSQREQYVLHLMNAHDKHDATYDFRSVRDNSIYVPRENAFGSMAAYHNAVHTENISKIVKSVLKEYIYKDRKIIIF